ncbi:MAG: TenA family protein [Dehalococcoidia bacterium]
MAFSQRLLAAAQPVWQASVAHPFVQEMAAGTLPKEKFGFWVQQDYLFVADARKFLGLLLARAEDEEIYRRLTQFLAGLELELELFRTYARDNNLSLTLAMAPVCRGYADFMLARAALGSFDEAMTALYAAEKAYYDAWRTVRDRTSPQGPYARWIANWSSDAFRQWVDWLAAALDRLTAGKPETELARLEKIFLTTARYEYLFWDMTYRQQQWPV